MNLIWATPEASAIWERLASPLSCTFLLFWLGACFYTEGQSSGEIKDTLLNSYLFKAVDRFYPDGAPADVDKLYPEVGDQEKEEIKNELETLLAALEKRHATKKEILQSLIDIPVLEKFHPGLAITDRHSPIAKTNSDGQIAVDVLVLQAIFRGALLENMRTTSYDEFPELPEFPSQSAFDASYDPSAATAEQQRAIQNLVETVERVKSTPAGSIFGDALDIVGTLVGAFDDHGGAAREEMPWFILADLQLSSLNLQTRYVGAVLFLLAHEQGHLALRHHERLKTLEEQSGLLSDPDLCEASRDFEREADAYAVLLLSPYTEKSAPPLGIMDVFGFAQNSTGYRNFFQYGYSISGFADRPGATCTYPTNEERYQFADALHETIIGRREEQFWEAVETAERE